MVTFKEVLKVRVLVIGANGAVGKHVVDRLKESDHQPVAMVRDTDQIPYFEEKNVETVLADLEKDFEKAFYNTEAVIFAAGSGPKTGADKTIIIDQEGAIEAADLAKKHGVNRFVMLSSMGADQPKQAEQIKHYLYAKHRADEHLKTSGLNYTILRPGRLTDEPASGKVNVHEGSPERGSVPRADVASVLVYLLSAPRAENKIFNLIEGSTPLSDVLAY